MRIDVSGRQSGKTHKMIEWMKANEDAIMLVFSEAEAARLRNFYDPQKIHGLWNRIVSLGKFRDSPKSFFRPVIAIDNAEFVLQQMLGDVQYITMTGGEDSGYLTRQKDQENQPSRERMWPMSSQWGPWGPS